MGLCRGRFERMETKVLSVYTPYSFSFFICPVERRPSLKNPEKYNVRGVNPKNRTKKTHCDHVNRANMVVWII